MSISIEEQQQKRIIELENQLQKQSAKKEQYYQRILEDKLNAKHGRNALGICDLINDELIAEIKDWDSIFCGIGQIVSYSTHTPRDRTVLYVFGIRPKQSKVDAFIEVCKKYNIELIELDNNGSETLLYQNEVEVDQYKEFTDKFIIMTSDPTDFLQWAELKEIFRSWYLDTYNKTLPKYLKKYKDYFNKKMAYNDTTQDGVHLRGYPGYKLRLQSPQN